MNGDVSGAWSVAGFLMATALATTISGVAAAQSPGPKIVNRSSASTVQGYWTPERVAGAKPMGMGVAGAPRRPAIGKLLFHDPVGGGDFYCTASVTTGSSSINNIIWTAGHCVANGGRSQFYTNWLFCPSHDNGNPMPGIGCWSWSFATTSSEWFASGPLAQDYAIVGLAHSGTVINADVATVTGSLGFAWNQGRDQHWIHIGYPQDPAPWTGLKLIETAAEHRYDDSAQGSPPTNSWGTSQGHGSVMLGFNYVNPPFINSDVSYYYVSQFGFEIQGPYFDTQVCNFWKGNTGFTGTC